MKRIIVLLGIILMSISVIGQKASIFKPVPKDLFTKNRSIQGEWLWRFSVNVTATELQWQKDLKQFVSVPLSSVGPAVGFKHFTALEDGVPYNDWGVSGALLLGTDATNSSPVGVKIAVLLNAFQYINVGACYTFNNTNHFGILLGGSLNF